MTKGKATTIERNQDVLVYLGKEANKIKLKIEERKVASGEQMEEVCAWSDGIDKVVEGVDAEIEHLGKCLGEAKQKSRIAEKESKKVTIAEEREHQLAFEKEKLEMKLEYERKSEEFKKGKLGETSGTHAKLPKLSITKFDGTFEQWLPFWNKFYSEIDSTDLPQVTKFAYLKELVLSKIRADIDGLPFSTEGHMKGQKTFSSQSMGRLQKLSTHM